MRKAYNEQHVNQWNWDNILKPGVCYKYCTSLQTWPHSLTISSLKASIGKCEQKRKGKMGKTTGKCIIIVGFHATLLDPSTLCY